MPWFWEASTLVQFVPAWAHHLDVSGLRWSWGPRRQWRHLSEELSTIREHRADHDELAWPTVVRAVLATPALWIQAVHLTPALYWPNRARWRTSKTNGSWRGAPA